MSHTYRKCRYTCEGQYGSTEEHWLYADIQNCYDIVVFYDETGERLFSSQDWETGKTMVDAIEKINNNLEGSENISYLEFKEIVKN